MQCAIIFILVRKKLQICTQSCIKNNNSRGEKSRFLPLYSLEFPLPPQETLEASDENHTIHLVVVLWQYGVDWGRKPRLPPLAPKVPQIHKNALFGNLIFFFYYSFNSPFRFSLLLSFEVDLGTYTYNYITRGFVIVSIIIIIIFFFFQSSECNSI